MLVIAHRGASWDEPENTPAAFEGAIDVGADYVELDVHATPGGELVVVHDPPRPQVAYPTLATVLDLLHGRVGVMVELKRPYRYRRHDVVRCALELLDDDDVVISFEPAALANVRRLRPRVRTLQHVGFGVSLRRAAGAWAVGFANGRVTPRALRKARSAGFETTVYTVNDAARMLQLADLGVTGVFTDRPDLARQILRHR